MKENTTQDSKETYRSVHEFYIAGVQHHQMYKVINKIKVDNYMQLVPEPSNKYDPNAIRIEFDGIMCGYVPKKFSSEITALFEIGKKLECIITELTPSAKPWEQCRVDVREVKDA